MIAVIQRVSEASVKIENTVKGKINRGVLVLLGIEDNDSQEDIDWLSRKIINLRIFNDDEGVMNKSLLEVDGEILLISQFTLHASTKKGNRPSYIKAAKPDVAVPLYEKMLLTLDQNIPTEIKSGEFGADMKVSLINDGPVTIIIDTKDKK
ncbi:D-aminoacyl-tRNA deacylase [Marivirga lumbricoides]|uniref:D-aminoacyl-tRNA deacylase n=1 Tax=Marivirga lumbricoides TaxID=1046115 RepID=A0ABQ1LIJ8_9BACT|nr:D-aminoacyl-tRNA deacylase [Marivirga lumbricoides]